MNKRQFVSHADFPTCWLENGLLEGQFFQAQIAEFESENGSKKPRGGTEHWRYGAFNYWLAQECNEVLLGHLLAAALTDPDPPMAGNVIMAIVCKPTCTESMLEVACKKVGTNFSYYVSPQSL